MTKLIGWSDDGARITLEHFVTGRDDATLWNVSFMSKPAEWHAAVLGVLAYVAPDVFLALGAPEEVVAMASVPAAVAYFVGRVNKEQAIRLADGMNLHWRDALREPAYFAGAYLLMGLVLDYQAVVDQVAGLLPA